MYGFRRRYLATIILFLSLIAVASLGGPVARGIKSSIPVIFKLPVMLSENIHAGLRRAFVPKGIFLSQIREKDFRIKILESQNSQAVELFQENQRLKSLLAFKQALTFQVTAARVIARDPSNWRHTIIIDKGADSGVKKNNFIISECGLVGRVVEAGRTVSKAILLTDPDFRVAGVCQRSREQMIVSGNARVFCNLKYLSRDADIQPKDTIVSSGLGGFCPKGILIGEVAAVSKSGDGMVRDAYVRPAVNLSRLEEVLVLTE